MNGSTSEKNASLAAATEVLPEATEIAWFDEPELAAQRRSSAPPSSVEKVGEFVGDPLVDSWLR